MAGSYGLERNHLQTVMSPKVSVFIATSLDGFIARKNGDVDWLNAANAAVPAGEDCGFQAFMETVDGLVMGRKTYQQVLTFGAWPYGQTPVVVLSRQNIDFPKQVPATVTCSSAPPADLCARLFQAGANHLYIDGGQTIRRFLSAGLVNELTLTLIPILLGEGIPLFGAIAQDIDLQCLSTHHYDFGFVQLKYKVITGK